MCLLTTNTILLLLLLRHKLKVFKFKDVFYAYCTVLCLFNAMYSLFFFLKKFFFQFQDFHFLCPNDTVFDQQVNIRIGPSLALAVIIIDICNITSLKVMSSCINLIQRNNALNHWLINNSLNVHFATIGLYQLVCVKSIAPEKDLIITTSLITIITIIIQSITINRFPAPGVHQLVRGGLPCSARGKHAPWSGPLGKATQPNYSNQLRNWNDSSNKRSFRPNLNTCK